MRTYVFSSISPATFLDNRFCKIFFFSTIYIKNFNSLYILPNNIVIILLIINVAIAIRYKL